MQWIKAESLTPNHYYSRTSIKVGDTIKIYGEETKVLGFHGAYNEGLEKWETIILTTGRGDPFERSIDVIEIDIDATESSPPTPQSGEGKSLEEEHRNVLAILEKHLGADFYKTGHLHNKLSDAMQEYANSRTSKLREALEWYGEQGEALAKYYTANNVTGIEACMIALKLDAGNRAIEALKKE